MVRRLEGGGRGEGKVETFVQVSYRVLVYKVVEVSTYKGDMDVIRFEANGSKRMKE